MTRPLLISDCDEVLLHMMRHFGAWLASDHDIDFVPQPEDFSQAMRYRHDGSVVEKERIWPLLDQFFETEMHRQTLVPHAIEALGRIGEVADIVILTNLGDQFHPHRVAQLETHGIRHEVVCNQGGKGPAVARIIAERQASPVVFVDDIAGHHSSVAKHVPDVWRLHMIAEPDIARLFPPAPDAHIRIDDWNEASYWILDRFGGR